MLDRVVTCDNMGQIHAVTFSSWSFPDIEDRQLQLNSSSSIDVSDSRCPLVKNTKNRAE